MKYPPELMTTRIGYWKLLKTMPNTMYR